LPLQIDSGSRHLNYPGIIVKTARSVSCPKRRNQLNRSDSGLGETGFDPARLRTSAFNLASIAGNIQSTHIQAFAIVFTDVRSASAAAAFALTWVAVVDKTRALNDRR
jgi:hypothetical protein